MPLGDKNDYEVFSIRSVKFSGAACVKCCSEASDATFYDLLNVMNQNTTTVNLEFLVTIRPCSSPLELKVLRMLSFLSGCDNK